MKFKQKLIVILFYDKNYIILNNVVYNVSFSAYYSSKITFQKGAFILYHENFFALSNICFLASFILHYSAKRKLMYFLLINKRRRKERKNKNNNFLFNIFLFQTIIFGRNNEKSMHIPNNEYALDVVIFTK